jgi:hypothetical protein
MDLPGNRTVRNILKHFFAFHSQADFKHRFLANPFNKSAVEIILAVEWKKRHQTSFIVFSPVFPLKTACIYGLKA